MAIATIPVNEQTLRLATSLAATMRCSVEDVVRIALDRLPSPVDSARPPHAIAALLGKWAAEPEGCDLAEMPALQAAIDEHRTLVGARRLFDDE